MVWRLRPGYSFIHTHAEPDASSQDSSVTTLGYDTPTSQFQIHSFLTLPRNVELDSAVYYVGGLRDGGDGPTPSYTRLDTRLGWRIGHALDISLVGQNLLSATHAEFHDDEMLHTLVARSLFMKFTWRF